MKRLKLWWPENVMGKMWWAISRKLWKLNVTFLGINVGAANVAFISLLKLDISYFSTISVLL